RARGDDVIPLGTGLQLNAGPGHDAGFVQVRAVEIEADVPEPVDRQHGRVDPRRADIGLGYVETGQRLGIDRRPELAEWNAECEMRSRRREEVAAVKRARDRLERVLGICELVRLSDSAELLGGRNEQS